MLNTINWRHYKENKSYFNLTIDLNFFVLGIVGRSVGLPDVHSGYGFAIGNMAAFDMEVT